MSMRRVLVMVPIFALMCGVAAPAFAGGSGGGKGKKATTNVRVKNLTDQIILAAATNSQSPKAGNFKEVDIEQVAQFKVNRGNYFVTYLDEFEEVIGQSKLATGSAGTVYVALELDEEGNVVADQTTTKF